MIQCAFAKRLGGGRAVFCQNVLFERSAVHADADRHAAHAASVGDGFYSFGRADVSGIYADLVDSALKRRKGELVIKMNVGDQRNVRVLLNIRNAFRRLFVRNRKAHNVAPRALERENLFDGRGGVCGFCKGHRLNGDRMIGADLDRADFYFF